MRKEEEDEEEDEEEEICELCQTPNGGGGRSPLKEPRNEDSRMSRDRAEEKRAKLERILEHTGLIVKGGTSEPTLLEDIAWLCSELLVTWQDFDTLEKCYLALLREQIARLKVQSDFEEGC